MNERLRVFLHFANVRVFNRRRRRYQGNNPVAVLVPFDDCLFLDCDALQAEFTDRVHVSTPRCSFTVGGWSIDEIAQQVQAGLARTKVPVASSLIVVKIQGQDIDVLKNKEEACADEAS